MTSVAIVDYGLANIRSVVNAFEYFGAEVTLAEGPADLEGAERIVLPGVGSFDAGMRGLRARGQAAALDDLVMKQRRPFFGVCLGMQFMLEGSAEGEEPGLGWIAGRAQAFDGLGSGLKVPHMGWNEVRLPPDGRLFSDMAETGDFYFVHSYYVPLESEAGAGRAAVCGYGLDFVAAFERDNLFACQFHPEKSQMAGMKLIENFLAADHAHA
ncbi:MAG: imidazole glycerol phosphate synthase subunit HisH [Kiloniellales bacterium]|nr:imidazole glycerol phosphate synthase subunit HisH [Kiloniellales bacterium]